MGNDGNWEKEITRSGFVLWLHVSQAIGLNTTKAQDANYISMSQLFPKKNFYVAIKASRAIHLLRKKTFLRQPLAKMLPAQRILALPVARDRAKQKAKNPLYSSFANSRRNLAPGQVMTGGALCKPERELTQFSRPFHTVGAKNQKSVDGGLYG